MPPAVAPAGDLLLRAARDRICVLPRELQVDQRIAEIIEVRLDRGDPAQSGSTRRCYSTTIGAVIQESGSPATGLRWSFHLSEEGTVAGYRFNALLSGIQGSKLTTQGIWLEARSSHKGGITNFAPEQES